MKRPDRLDVDEAWSEQGVVGRIHVAIFVSASSTGVLVNALNIALRGQEKTANFALFSCLACFTNLQKLSLRVGSRFSNEMAETDDKEGSSRREMLVFLILIQPESRRINSAVPRCAKLLDQRGMVQCAGGAALEVNLRGDQNNSHACTDLESRPIRDQPNPTVVVSTCLDVGVLYILVRVRDDEERDRQRGLTFSTVPLI